MKSITWTALFLMATVGPAWAQGRSGGGGGGKEGEEKKDRLTFTLKCWDVKSEGFEETVKEAYSKLKIVLTTEVDIEKRLVKVTFAGSHKDAAKLEETLAKVNIPSALYDPGRFIFQLKSGSATPDEIKAMLKTASGGIVEPGAPGQYTVWAAPFSLEKLTEEADKLKIKLDCLTHVEHVFSAEREDSAAPDYDGFLKKLDQLRGVIQANKSDKKITCLAIKAMTKMEHVKKLAKSMNLVTKDIKNEEVKK